MVWPPLIAASLAPGSYFFFAGAGKESAAASSAATENEARFMTTSLASAAARSRFALPVALDHLPEQLVLLAVKALELHRLQRRVVLVAGGDGDARQQRVDPEVLHRRGLL